MVQAVEFVHEGSTAVLLWSDAADGGMAFRLRTESGEALTLNVTEAGIVDDATGSTWTVDGRAVSGEMEGERLIPIAGAYVSFWGAWSAFNPDASLWEG